MGAPELPNDPGDDGIRNTNIVYHPPTPSDDSDNESMIDGGVYEGYQPLAIDDHRNDYEQMPLDVDNFGNYYTDDLIRIQESRDLDENETAEVVRGYPNMPQIDTADVEIQREVWNQPRPQELQIELDGNKTQQVDNGQTINYMFICTSMHNYVHMYMKNCLSSKEIFFRNGRLLKVILAETITSRRLFHGHTIDFAQDPILEYLWSSSV